MLRRSPDDPSSPVEPRPAATIVLVRTGPDGLEVLLTRRPDSMAFAAGLHVFPGGRVETDDADPRLVALARGPVDDPDFHVAHRIAAIRETWEEVGVLLADAPPPRAQTGPSFASFADEANLVLRTDDLVEIARWTTPRAYPRRFDARFFVAELPPGAALRPDAREVAAHDWLTPRAALAAMAAGTIALWPPTSTTLQRLERARSFAAIQTGLARSPEPPIRVERIDHDLRLMTGQSAFGPAGRPANTVLVGTREVVVVDPGDPGEDFLDAIEAEVESGGGRIVAIALTHVDPGHAAGSEELRERTGAPLVGGPGGAASLSWPVVEIGDGALVGESGDGTLTAIATPGHRPDHLSFLAADGTLIAGDALTDRPTLIVPPEGDEDAQRSTRVRIDSLVAAGRIRRIVPGHGPGLLRPPDSD
jgi:glyoxylase-like metal-dependent hydrolase (beta-lactamase superfamily II)/8-oxo-dGTP pyrophosphatase MutT (NUDIX family)